MKHLASLKKVLPIRPGTPDPLLFITAVIAIVDLSRRLRLPWPVWGWRLPVYSTGSLAAFCTIESLTGILLVDL